MNYVRFSLIYPHARLITIQLLRRTIITAQSIDNTTLFQTNTNLSTCTRHLSEHFFANLIHANHSLYLSVFTTYV